MGFRSRLGFWLVTALALTAGSGFASETVHLSILHTNDLHSHFRPERIGLGLGGVARLRTLIRSLREANPDTVVVDAGDFSEGQVYYNLGAGVQSIRMLDHLGYDAVVIGNHDFLNGPDVLLQTLQEADPGPRLKVLAGNVDLTRYPRKDLFEKLIHPAAIIRTISGVRVALIGITTYEFIYDSYFEPVKITSPHGYLQKVASELKKHANVVIAVSHNAIGANTTLLKNAPSVDLIIGAHDHVKLTRPLVVERNGARPGWIVEAGSHGRYLGKVDLEIALGQSQGNTDLALASYRLLQVDSTISEDPETAARIDELEIRLENQYSSPIFHDHVADSEIELSRSGLESTAGDLVTDAYRAATGADIALDHVNFIPNELPRGELRTVDFINTLPAIYDAKTAKTWTVKVAGIKGSSLKSLINGFFLFGDLSQGSPAAISGVRVVVDPSNLAWHRKAYLASRHGHLGRMFRWFYSGFLASPETDTTRGPAGPVISFEVNGEPLELKKTYRVALGGGILESFQFLNQQIPGTVVLHDLQDTGVETWRTLAEYVRSTTPLSFDDVHYGGRLLSQRPDLAVDLNELELHPVRELSDGTLLARLLTTVRNLGATASPEAGSTVQAFLDQNGANTTLDPSLIPATPAAQVGALAPGASRRFEWSVRVPRTVIGQLNGMELFGVHLKVTGGPGELVHSNDEALRWFRRPTQGVQPAERSHSE